MLLVEVVFWLAVALLVYTHLGYPLALLALSGLRGPRDEPPVRAQVPTVTLFVAAHNEEDVIAGWVQNALSLAYRPDRLGIVVVCDGCTDATAQRAREAGAHRVLEVERGGKVAALNAAVTDARGDIFAFSDANARWELEALNRLVARLEDADVGYVCGRVILTAGDDVTNEEGLYWRYEMAIREMESELAGVTAGNGAINAIRREAFIKLDPKRGQDISFPFELQKKGWRAVYEPEARAIEAMAPTIEGEFQRKRRMMAGAWNTILNTRMLSPLDYAPMYAFQIYSHRLFRYLTPFLHLVALGTNVALAGESGIYLATLVAQLALLFAAAVGGILPLRPFRLARYYVAVTVASAVGLWDYLRRGVPQTWESVEGTR